MAGPSGFAFSSDALEQEYQRELGAEKIRLTRIMTLLAIGLNLAFALLDLLAIPSAVLEVWSIRAILVAALGAGFVCTWTSVFRRLYPYLILLVFVLLGAGINAMIYLAEQTDVAVEAYYGGLNLIIIGLYTLTYVKLAVSAFIALTVIAGYVGIAIGVHGYAAGPERVVVVAQTLFLVSTTLIGIVAQSLRDRYSRENYLLRHSLQRNVELKEEEKRRVSYLAEHDPLTGLANRLRFEAAMETLLQRAGRVDDLLVVMFVDLDDFKPVNDRHGHAVGDRVLKTVAERLRRATDPADVVARLGGDEFVVATILARGAPGTAGLRAERLAAAVREPIEIRGATLRLSVSIGVAACPGDGADLASLLRVADEQMYRVKQSGKAGIALTPAAEAGTLSQPA